MGRFLRGTKSLSTQHALSLLLDIPQISRDLRALGRAQGEARAGDEAGGRPEAYLARAMHFTGLVHLADAIEAGSFEKMDDRPEAPPGAFDRAMMRIERLRAEISSSLSSPFRGEYAAPNERALYEDLAAAGVLEARRKRELEAALREIAPRFTAGFRAALERARRTLAWLRTDIGDALKLIGGEARTIEEFDRLVDIALRPSRDALYDELPLALEEIFVRAMVEGLRAEPKGYTPPDLIRFYEVGGAIYDLMRLMADLGTGLVDREIDSIRALAFQALRPASSAQENL